MKKLVNLNHLKTFKVCMLHCNKFLLRNKKTYSKFKKKLVIINTMAYCKNGSKYYFKKSSKLLQKYLIN